MRLLRSSHEENATWQGRLSARHGRVTSGQWGSQEFRYSRCRRNFSVVFSCLSSYPVAYIMFFVYQRTSSRSYPLPRACRQNMNKVMPLPLHGRNSSPSFLTTARAPLVVPLRLASPPSEGKGVLSSLSVSQRSRAAKPIEWSCGRQYVASLQKQGIVIQGC